MRNNTDCDVSIIICTRNRAGSLEPTLKSIAEVVVPGDWDVELLVVDNGSTDNTAAIVSNQTFQKLRVRYVFEEKPGQCHARNRGLAESSGRIILFTDDDVRVGKDWVVGMCRPILAGEADAVAGGVRLAPHLEKPWLRNRFRHWLACTEYLDPNKPERMVGANMAFSRRILEKVPRFDVELGPGALGFYDETLFTEQFLHAGYRLGGALNVEVEHHPDEARICADGFLRMAKAQSRSEAYMNYHWRQCPYRFVYARLLYFGILSRAYEVKRRIRLMFGNSVPLLEHLNAVYQYNFFVQLLKERLRPRNYDRQGLIKHSSFAGR